MNIEAKIGTFVEYVENALASLIVSTSIVPDFYIYLSSVNIPLKNNKCDKCLIWR